MTKIDDVELRRKVIEELDWEASIDASSIGVGAKEGIVTLSGSVSSYPQKRNAERAARRVAGVRAVAEDLLVKLPGAAEQLDTDLAESVLERLRNNVSIPHERIKATVENGWVRLDGEVEWQFQKVTAENAIKHTRGVKGVTNRIVVRPSASATDVKAKIESAFTRRALADAHEITVESIDNRVVLRGNVHSWQAKEDAEQAAWSAPGVSNVDNRIIVNAR